MATLTECWASVGDDVQALKQRWLHVIVQRFVCLLDQSVPEAYTTTLKETRKDVESMLVQRLSTVYDVGSKLSQH